MCDKEDRMRTFSNSWYDQESPTPHKLVGAGFYYMSSGDRVNCFLLWRAIISLETA